MENDFGLDRRHETLSISRCKVRSQTQRQFITTASSSRLLLFLVLLSTIGSLSHLSQHAGLRNIRHVDEDIVSGVAIQRSTEALLVEVVSNEADAATEDEEAVERADLRVALLVLYIKVQQKTDLDVLVRLLGCERPAVAKKIDEADGDAPVHVEDELVPS
jgi:hypothetical protein